MSPASGGVVAGGQSPATPFGFSRRSRFYWCSTGFLAPFEAGCFG